MKLYYTKRSPYARKVLVTAYEKGVFDRLELVEVNLAMKPSSLVKSNPIGKIPTLIGLDGVTYVESPVICEYLNGLSPTPLLYGTTAQTRLSILNELALCDGVMNAAVDYMIETFRPVETQQDRLKKHAFATIHRILDRIEGDDAFLNRDLDAALISLGVGLAYLDFRIPEFDWRSSHTDLSGWLDAFNRRESMLATLPSLT